MTFLMMFIQALRAWILHEDQVLSAGRSTLADFARGNTILASAFDLLAAAYRDLTLRLGLPLIPDQLPFYGPVGATIHTVACQTKGCWPAFRRGVERRYPSIPYPTPLTEGTHKVASFAELATLKWLAPLPGISCNLRRPTWLHFRARGWPAPPLPGLPLAPTIPPTRSARLPGPRCNASTFSTPSRSASHAPDFSSARKLPQVRPTGPP